MFAVSLQCLFVNEDVKSPNGIVFRIEAMNGRKDWTMKITTVEQT